MVPTEGSWLASCFKSILSKRTTWTYAGTKAQWESCKQVGFIGKDPRGRLSWEPTKVPHGRISFDFHSAHRIAISTEIYFSQFWEAINGISCTIASSLPSHPLPQSLLPPTLLQPGAGRSRNHRLPQRRKQTAELVKSAHVPSPSSAPSKGGGGDLS